MQRRARWVLLTLVLQITSAAAVPALAHPLGNFSISHHAALVVVVGLVVRLLPVG